MTRSWLYFVWPLKESYLGDKVMALLHVAIKESYLGDKVMALLHVAIKRELPG